MGGGTSADATGLVNDNNSRVSDITSNGYTTSSVMSFNTEWNSSYSGQGGGTGDNLTSMDNNWNVGLILKGMKMLSDKNSGNTPPIAVSSYWVLSDVFDESSGTAGSWILSHSGGNLPFGQVFGLMTAQGVRKAAFNAYKMLNQLGPVRLSSAGGTYNDGVDAMATMSSAGDSLQILTYDYYKTLNTTGSDSVTVQVSNLPSALSGKQVFVTQFVVDATHSNPYSVWTSQSSPTNPSESQWQAMKAAQHLALMQPVSTTTLSSSYSTTFTINRQAGTLLIVSTKRPVTGRNGLATIEAEDWDGRSSATSPAKADCTDTDLGQFITGVSGDSVFYDVVDFSDAGVGSVQMRVNATSATNLEFHADSATGTLLGKCAVSATTGWATQSCTLSPISGVHTLYVVFDGSVQLNWLLFQSGGGSPGTGGSGGGTGGATGSGGSGNGTGGNGSTGSGGSGSGGSSGGGGASGGSSGSGGSPGSGGSSGSGGSMVTGSGGSGSGGSSSSSGSGGSGSGGDSGSGGSGSGGSGNASGGNSGAGGSSPASGGGGCACSVDDARGPSGTMLLTAFVAVALGLRRRRRP
jgi:MYXO-CTERM domain-containing protein